MYASRQLKPVILQHMEVIFSHTTALDFLRMWSCNHPLALRAFHDLRSRDVGHLPSSHLKGFSSLARAADTEAAVRAAIESAKRPSLKRMLEELWGNATVERPLHVLARPKIGRHSTKRVCFHQLAAPLLRGAFLEIAPGVPYALLNLCLSNWPKPSLWASSLLWDMSFADATPLRRIVRARSCGRSLQRRPDSPRSLTASSA